MRLLITVSLNLTFYNSYYTIDYELKHTFQVDVIKNLNK